MDEALDGLTPEQAYKLKSGDVVKIRVYGGKMVERIVLKELREVIVACAPEEYQRAAGEGRRPEGIGFPRKDVQPLSGRRPAPTQT